MSSNSPPAVQAPARRPRPEPGSAARAWQAAGQRLRAARESAGISQRDLGALISYDRRTVSDAEHGLGGAVSLWHRADAELGMEGELVRMQEAARSAAGPR